MAFQGFVAARCCSEFHQYLPHTSRTEEYWLENIHYLLILHSSQWLAMHLTVVETTGRSFEEFEEIFDDVLVTHGAGVTIEMN
jgi:hypothetical protein